MTPLPPEAQAAIAEHLEELDSFLREATRHFNERWHEENQTLQGIVPPLELGGKKVPCQLAATMEKGHLRLFVTYDDDDLHGVNRVVLARRRLSKAVHEELGRILEGGTRRRRTAPAPRRGGKPKTGRRPG